MEAAAETLLSFRPDVVAVQETHDARALIRAFNTLSSDTWYAEANGAFVVLSRFRLERPEQPQSALAVRVVLRPDRQVVLWTLRAPKDYASPNNNSMFFRKLVSEIQHQSPQIVAGDFNSTPWNDGYRATCRLLKDSFAEGGLWLGFTFPTRARRLGTLFPFVRIDHVFVEPAISVVNVRTGNASAGADHYPVIVDLIIP